MVDALIRGFRVMFRLSRLFRGPVAAAARPPSAADTAGAGVPAPLSPPRPFDPARIRQSRLREFHGLWTALRGDRPAPARGDFGPESFRAMLPHLFLVEVEAGEPTRFTFRLVGTELERILGHGLAQQAVEPVPRDRWAGTLYGAYANCAVTLRPVYDYLRTRLPDGAVGEFERLTLPLSADGATATHLIGCAMFTGGFGLRDAWGRAG